MTHQTFIDTLTHADFSTLFNEMGWDRPSSRGDITISVDDCEIAIREVARKSGFHAYTCVLEELPQHASRRKIDTRLRKYGNDYILVCIQSSATLHHQWIVPVKTVEKRELVAVEYATPDQASFLFEKARAISFGLTQPVTIVDVCTAVHTAFKVNTSKITKEFYRSFKQQHEEFAGFIEGIPKDEKKGKTEEKERKWYASVMLNRLMFCYFIQKKGFLDLDFNYLGNKFRQVTSGQLDLTTESGASAGKFFSFYRTFLRALFSDGLNSPRHSPDFEKRFGRIPYLNGGLFEPHEIERKYAAALDIPDNAFKSLFDFFDQWQWHLDTRLTASGRDINPDVLGYIFEQYINDRAEMGAYYTKEDITEYIAKNCILPYLFDAVSQTESAKHFKTDGFVWQLVKDSGDAYIYDAVKKGADLPLPPEIERGLAVASISEGPSLRERRAAWNQPADARYALPTEIWRETVARRQRCHDLRRKIAAGDIVQINDFITGNLDIRQFAQDLLEKTDDPRLVRHFYDALRRITVLDPTCGSGAFLFAALNILEPLYEACITRMQEFHAGNKHLFKDELGEIEHKYRSNIQHYIYKSIILRNLYGVDLMHEATEIARLRLFLKMVAVVDVDRRAENLGLDPLPDIDFNIRCGNTLVGFASPEDVKKALTPEGQLGIFDDVYQQIDAKASDVAIVNNRFKALQLDDNMGSVAFHEAKKELKAKLAELNGDMDVALAKTQYSIDTKTLTGNKAFQKWRTSHQPFHWYSEFYDIIVERGGFDVIIGNPPYVEIETVKDYSVEGYQCKPTGNLYAVTMERSRSLASSHAWRGFIVPVSSISTDGYLPLQNMLKTQSLWYSSFDDRPSRLFEGLEHIRLTIHIIGPSASALNYTSSRYNKWNADERDALFDSLALHPVKATLIPTSLPKLCTVLEDDIVSKVLTSGKSLGTFLSPNHCNSVYYTRKTGYFLQMLGFVPEILTAQNEVRLPSELKEIRLVSEDHAASALICLNSNLFYWFFTVCSDCRNVNKREIEAFPVDLDTLIKNSGAGPILSLASRLMDDIRIHSEFRKMRFKHDTLTVQCILPKYSKSIIDEIDELLARHYGFTEEELDFIVNYDIKYRMGDELTTEEE